jgi:hypothetical protein
VITRFPGNRWFVTTRFLSLLADGGDRLQVCRRSDDTYVQAEWYRGVRYELVLPECWYIQSLPATLASFEPRLRRVWANLTRPFRRLSSGRWSGEFDLPVGPQFVVRVLYWVVWRKWRLSEMEARIAEGSPLAAVARVELDRLFFGD